MDTKITTQEFAQKVMEGLNLAINKLMEEAHKNNQPVVVSIDGKVQLIYP